VYLPLLLGHAARRYWLAWTARILREQNMVATRDGVLRCRPVWLAICGAGASNPYGYKLYMIQEMNWRRGRENKHLYNIIDTRCKLVGPGIESRWGARFSCTRPDSPSGTPNLLYNGYRVSFLGVKWPELGVDEPPPSSTEVKERVELYFRSPSGPW